MITKTRRIFSILITVCMIVALFPCVAMAASPDKDENGNLLLNSTNFSDANFTEAKITFTVTKSNVKYDLSFDKNTPICKIKINPTLMISEVNQSELDSDIYISPYMLGTKELKTAVEAKVCDDTKQIVEKFVDANLDVNQIYEKFNAKLTKKFQSYLSDLLDENEYLKGIRFEYECDAKIIS